MEKYPFLIFYMYFIFKGQMYLFCNYGPEKKNNLQSAKGEERIEYFWKDAFVLLQKVVTSFGTMVSII